MRLLDIGASRVLFLHRTVELAQRDPGWWVLLVLRRPGEVTPLALLCRVLALPGGARN